NVELNNENECFAKLFPVLLDSWSSKLTKLSINVYDADPLPIYYWVMINGIPHLNDLSLTSMKNSIIPENFPALRRLTHFYLEGYSADLFSVLRQFGPNLNT